MEDEKVFDVTAMGEILIDFTPKGQSQERKALYERNPGGAPANVVCALSRLGARTAFLGKVGNDIHGKYLRRVLEEENVETRGLVSDKKIFTTLAFVELFPDGEREFSFARSPGADMMLTAEEVDKELIAQSGIFHFGSLSLTDEPVRSATWTALRRAREQGCMISYDPNYRASLWRSRKEAVEQMRSVLPYADIIKLSEEEVELLTGETDAERGAELLLSKGISLVAVTMGEKGAYLRTAQGGQYIPTRKVKCIDATGAGDSFWGAFLYRLARSGKTADQLTLEEGAEFAAFANVAASLCVEKRGAIPAMPTYAQVMDVLNK